jgi:hypothetical protein
MEASSGTLDLLKAQYDSNILSTSFLGLEYYDIRRTGANGFEANKFQLKATTSLTYSINEDLRYEN